MNIALIGYGKMGQAIERIATSRGHKVVLRIQRSNESDLTTENLKKADVAIEFTSPEVAAGHVRSCIQAGVPVICGSTGWNSGLPAAIALAEEKGVGFLQASNFSIGVNIFFEINKKLAQLMAQQSSYMPSMEEVHHLQKKDAPSGTAISLAEQILANDPHLSRWILGRSDDPKVLGIEAKREDLVPGTHTIEWHSEVDKIEIRHTAHNRDGFALGAVLAAEFIPGKKGSYSMKDVLGI